MGKEELLKKFLDSIYKEINPASFHAWFNDLKIIVLTNNKITFKVPMEIHKKMLGDNYYTLIEKTLSDITNINYDIDFVLESDIDETPALVVNNESSTNNNFQTNLNPNLNFDNFVVGDTNRLAKVAAMAVAEAPGRIHNPLFIYGKSGLGKTHLMHAIGNFITENSNRKVLYCTCDEFMTEYTNIANPDNAKNTVEYANDFKNKYRNVDVLIIDDIQYLVGAEKTQQEFFNTFNYLHQSNKQIIISSDRSPEDLKILEERLRSRFMWGLPVDIYPPDFDLRCRIIRKKIENTSIANLIKEESIEYIANACQNDVRFLEGAVNRLMAYTAMIVPKTIDLEFTCEALKDFVNKNIYSLVRDEIERLEKKNINVSSRIEELEKIPCYFRGKGLPIGNMTSQILAIYYLNDLDHFIKEKLHIKYYVRYMDDFVLMHGDREYLKFCYQEIEKKLKELKLSFNKKTQTSAN